MTEPECEIELKPVAEWLQSKEGCPPCLVAPLASYYLGVLNAAGETKMAEELLKTYEGGDALTICKKLDSIKSTVGEALSRQLKILDCHAQTFKLEDAGNQAV